MFLYDLVLPLRPPPPHFVFETVSNRSQAGLELVAILLLQTSEGMSHHT